MLLKIMKRLFPNHRKMDIELNRASSSVRLSINRYKNLSLQIQKEVENNGFAKYLIYDKGEKENASG